MRPATGGVVDWWQEGFMRCGGGGLVCDAGECNRRVAVHGQLQSKRSECLTEARHYDSA